MTRTILLADDSVTIQKVVELTFVDHDLEVVAVGSGDEAMTRLEETRPALVIADVHMPGADGYEVCRRVKQQSPSTPVLLLVGTFEPFDDASVEAAGAQGHLKKPFDSQELLRVVLEMLGDEPAAAAEPAAATSSEPAPEPEPAAAVSPEPPAEESTDGALTDAEVERIAKRVVELLSDKAVRDVAWEVVPDLAELLIRDRLRELERQAD